MAESKKVEDVPEKSPPVLDDESKGEGEEEEEGEEEAVEKVVEEEEAAEKVVGEGKAVEKVVEEEKAAEKVVEEEEPEGETEVKDLTQPRIKSDGDKRTLRVSGNPSSQPHYSTFNIPHSTSTLTKKIDRHPHILAS